MCSVSASARHRTSPYELVSFDTAMKNILEHTQPLDKTKRPVSSLYESYQYHDAHSTAGCTSSERPYIG